MVIQGASGYGNGDADGQRFSVSVRPGVETVVVALSGELDHDTAAPLRDALEEAVSSGARRVLADCTGLSFCDSTGLNALLQARLAAEGTGARLELAALQPVVARMFQIAGADEVFRTYESLDEALAQD
ncbi:STAS domain-containing protein [Actinacidiphila oryziradicis]|uniref:Anti-sigma factor antagonist n=1 Tax=Actinacidiphila oryziradicis TaxID=2571141 RepID=A0A4U0SBF4_9ACTN|nr:STAS domain-containing protein [Actinacidiphila oryziradicis]TKA06694.1 STAS domain-containing protein [Actinacidiphila oryziradicis]